MARLHDRRRGAAGVDAADAARVPQHLHEDRHDRVPRDRRDDPQPGARRRRRSRTSSAAADRSFQARSSRSCSSRSRAARSRASTRSSRPARPRRWSTGRSDIRPIGYGAMLVEGVVGVVAIITAASLHPGDYYAINTTPEVFQTLGMTGRQPARAAERGRRNRRRPSGRRGVARRRHGADLQRPARHARADGVLVPLRDHVRGGLHPDDDRLGHARSAASCFRSSAGACGSRSPAPTGCPARSARPSSSCSRGRYFIWTGNISTIWPLFGVANQLLAVVALAVGTTIVINIGRAEVRVGYVPAAVLHRRRRR